MSDNVLLHLGEEPRFDQIKTEDIKPALQTAIAEAREQIAAIKAQTHTDWANTVEKLTDITERVGRIWSVVSHLNSVVDTPELRAVYNELMPEITIFFTEIGQDIELYDRFKIIKNSAEFDTLSQAQQTKLNHDLRDFDSSAVPNYRPNSRQNWRNCKPKARNWVPNSHKTSKTRPTLSAFTLTMPRRLPASPKTPSPCLPPPRKAKAKQATKSACKIPHYLAVIQYADNRELREQIYRAYVTRASELSDEGKFDNTANVEQTLANALKTAKLLGFKNYAELSLATKMADTPEQVLNFLHDLARRAKPFAEKDFAEIKAFARENLNIEDPQSWDLSYAAEKLRQAKYAFSETEVKKYFPISKVLAGLFAQIKKTLRHRAG